VKVLDFLCFLVLIAIKGGIIAAEKEKKRMRQLKRAGDEKEF
jgi:hypothetical protein